MVSKTRITELAESILYFVNEIEDTDIKVATAFLPMGETKVVLATAHAVDAQSACDMAFMSSVDQLSKLEEYADLREGMNNE